jgi:hypothetical protein
VLAVASLPLGATAATAAVPPCPPVPDEIATPEPPSDTDRLVRELRELRREQAASCDVLRSAGVETRDGLAPLAAPLVLERGASSTSPLFVTGDTNTSTAAPAGTNADPSFIRVADSDPIVPAAYDGLREALYLLAGLLVASIVAPFIRRLLWP